MSKKRKPHKERPAASRAGATPTKPATPKQRKAVKKASPADMVFGKDNYVVMLAGLALVVIGMVLMSGGAMTNPNEWDESRIYSPMRITVAPILILAGLGLNIYAIFKKSKPSTEPATTEEQ